MEGSKKLLQRITTNGFRAEIYGWTVGWTDRRRYWLIVCRDKWAETGNRQVKQDGKSISLSKSMKWMDMDMDGRVGNWKARQIDRCKDKSTPEWKVERKQGNISQHKRKWSHRLWMRGRREAVTGIQIIWRKKDGIQLQWNPAPRHPPIRQCPHIRHLLKIPKNHLVPWNALKRSVTVLTKEGERDGGGPQTELGEKKR